jgi:PAS domain S-box-containing protein
MDSTQDWLTLLQNQEPWGKWVGFLLLIAGLWRYAVLPFVKYALGIKHTAQSLSQALPILKEMAEQFRNNGGSSLRDAIDRIENGIALSNQRIRAVCAYMDLAIFEADTTGAYVFVSKDWSAMTGLGQDEARGDGWVNGVQAEQRDSVMSAWKKSISEKREFALEYPIYLPNGHGQTIHVVSRAFPSRRLQGGQEIIVGVIGILRRAEVHNQPVPQI